MFNRFLALLLFLAVVPFASAQLQSGSPWPKDHGNALNTSQGVGSGATGLLEWTWGTSSDVCSSAVVAADGTIYFGDANNGVYELVAINGATGVQKWVASVGGQIEASPAIGADGTIYVDSDDGNMYAFTDKWTSASTKWTLT